MRKTFDNIVQQHNEYTVIIEDVINMLPDTPKNYKLKKKVEAAHKSMKQAIYRHEDVISDAIPPIKHKTSDYPKDFVDTWSVYKDFLIEQFGIRMQSRMQKYRLQLLFELTENDFSKANKWLQYYMAAGSSNIFLVNELKLEEKKDEQKGTKAGFSIDNIRKNS